MRGILLVSHGSQSSKTKEEVEDLLARLSQSSPGDKFFYAFLDIESPDIPTGLEDCVRAGATEVIVLLNFLNSGRHVDTDIPALVEQARRDHPQVRFRITRPVGQHPRIVELFRDILTHP